MSTESDIQVAPDSTGSRVRTLEVNTYEPDADGVLTLTSVHQQVIVMADRLGRIIENDTAWREEMLAEARKTNEWLEIIATAVTPGSG